ncbi:thiazole/oxazole-forming peptide maturase SagD family component [Sporosarcina luteola]|nr:thiazole/oxazole-forming peptide maturase SagD family component [Sporosarcina luteola]
MPYKLDETPFISEQYGYKNDEINNRVICSSSGQIKILNCEPSILEEVLYHIDGSNTFGEIEEKFIDRYSISEVRNFLEVIIKEGVIKKKRTDNKTKKAPNILVIGEGVIAKTFWDGDHIAVDSFLEKDFFYDFDIAIFAPSALTYSDMFSVNEKLYQLRKPYIQISFNGVSITAGPLVIPNKSACLECGVSHEIKRLNSKDANGEKVGINDLENLKYSCDIPGEFELSKVTYIGDMIRKNVTDFFNGFSSVFLDSQYFFDLDTPSHTKEERLPTTYCGFCKAFNRDYVRFDSSSMDFHSVLNRNENMNLTSLTRDSIKYKVGGLRSKTETETRELLNADLNKLAAKVKIEPAFGNPFNDNDTIHCYNAFVEQANGEKMPYLFRKTEGAGKGLTKSQSYFSAAFELLEHMSLQYTGDIPIICAKYSDVKEIAIDMPKLASTIMNKNTAFDDFDENEEIDWVVATSLTGTEKRLVPASLVFMYDVELKGTLFGPSSNGAAAATTIEDAILHGLFEIIERDAWLIGQSNPYILPVVDYTSVTSQKLKGIISRIKQMGYDIITRDYTNDLNIPVFRTWIVDRNDYSRYAYTGFGCHISPEIALERSITEAVQIDDWSSSGGVIDSEMITLPVLSNSLVNLYNQHHLVNKDIFGETDKITKIGKPIFEMDSSYDVIKNVAKLIKEKIGGDVYFVDLTKPDMNVKVVRTIVTGDIQQMNIPLLSVSKRMFEFGKRCGYSNEKTIYEELFMGKYQH